MYLDFPGSSDSKRSHLQCRKSGFSPLVGNTPWRREWESTPLFLPGESMDRGAWWAAVYGAIKELDTSEQLTHTLTYTYTHINSLSKILFPVRLSLNIEQSSLC